MSDIKQVGQGRQYTDAVTADEAERGKYHDGASEKPEAERLPSGQLPKAPDPSPFTLGPLGPTGR